MDKLPMSKLTVRRLFLVDGLGAFSTALLLTFVVRHLKVGIPESILFMMALTAVMFSIYSMSCFVIGVRRLIWLRVIGTLNVLYCIFSLGVLFLFADEVTLLGWLYFVGEVVLVLILASIELRFKGNHQ